MKKCYYCGVEIEDDADFCTACGSELPDCTCPQCGADVRDDDNYCQNCGYDLLNDEGVEIYDESGDGVVDTLEEVEESPKSKIIIPIVVGIIALALIGGWYFLKSTNDTTETKELVSTDVATIDTDSLVVDEEISDVHSEAFIKKRLEEVCKAIYSIDEEKVVEKYFSTEFKKLYNTITTLEKSGKGGDGLWYSGGFFDGSSEGVDSMSAGKIYSIEDNIAKADFIYYNGNHKYTQLARLVLEDGNWFVDDICDRMSDMSEYIEYMMNNDNSDESKSQEELARENTAIGAFTIDEDSIR